MLKQAGVRATLDESSERIQGKIKAATEWKIPYLLVVGERDAEAKAVSVRARGVQENLGAMGASEFVAAISEEIRTRAAQLTVMAAKGN
jgi:threonyl-tRNA synthetase